jgi:hypothetical protein
VEGWVFHDDGDAAAETLAVQRGDVAMGVGGQDPEVRRHFGELLAVKVIEKVGCRLGTITEFDSRLAWDGEF